MAPDEVLEDAANTNVEGQDQVDPAVKKTVKNKKIIYPSTVVLFEVGNSIFGHCSRLLCWRFWIADLTFMKCTFDNVAAGKGARI